MASVNYDQCIPSSSHNDWTERKRHATDDCLSDCSTAKKRRMYHVILESESDLPTDESSESVYSVQDKETDFAKDTSDTSSHSDNSDRLNDFVEFEVVSESEGETNPLGEVGEISSGAEDYLHFSTNMTTPFLTLFVDEEFEVWADSSSDTASRDSFDAEIPRADYWTCLQCKTQNNNPLFRYCEKCFQFCTICKKKKEFGAFLTCLKCFQVRKSFFPDRPRKRKPRKRNNRNESKKKDESPKGKNLIKDISGATTESLSEDEIKSPETKTKKLRSNSQDIGTLSQVSTLNSQDTVLLTQDSTIISQDTGSLSQDSTANSQDSAICLLSIDDTVPQEKKLIASHSATVLPSPPQSPLLVSTRSEPTHSEIGMCITCMTRPKNGIYIHPNGTSHLCCCYECAHRVWLTTKKCPICNGKITNISKLFVY